MDDYDLSGIVDYAHVVKMLQYNVITKNNNREEPFERWVDVGKRYKAQLLEYLPIHYNEPRVVNHVLIIILYFYEPQEFMEIADYVTSIMCGHIKFRDHDVCYPSTSYELYIIAKAANRKLEDTIPIWKYIDDVKCPVVKGILDDKWRLVAGVEARYGRTKSARN